MMMDSRARLPLLAGLILGVAGWSGAGLGPEGPAAYQSQLMVRPSSVVVRAVNGPNPLADQSVRGRYLLPQVPVAIELQAPGEQVHPVAQPSSPSLGMTTWRVPPAPASLTVLVKGDQSAQTSLLGLPEKTRLSRKGPAHLDPGRHSLLVEAPGYLPAKLDLDLQPGEGKVVELAMVARPHPQPAYSAAAPARPVVALAASRPARTLAAEPSIDSSPSYPTAPSGSLSRHYRRPRPQSQPQPVYVAPARPSRAALAPATALKSTATAQQPRLGAKGILQSYHSP